MHRIKPFFVFLTLSAACILFSAGLNAQLIEPTRTLEGATTGEAVLNVPSEPPGLEVQLNGKVIGKTPIFSIKLPAGLHVLRIKDSETEIETAAGKKVSMSWFKGAFIEIPTTVKRPADIVAEPPKPAAKPKPEGQSGTQQGTANDPFYWPLNPRGPIY